jgi:hypothetical protein
VKVTWATSGRLFDAIGRALIAVQTVVSYVNVLLYSRIDYNPYRLYLPKPVTIECTFQVHSAREITLVIPRLCATQNVSKSIAIWHVALGLEYRACSNKILSFYIRTGRYPHELGQRILKAAKPVLFPPRFNAGQA